MQASSAEDVYWKGSYPRSLIMGTPAPTAGLEALIRPRIAIAPVLFAGLATPISKLPGRVTRACATRDSRVPFQ